MGVYQVTYSQAHWIFAFHYWSASKRLESVSHGMEVESLNRNLRIVFWTFLFANTFIPSMLGWDLYFATRT
jgi:hypothetical protein